MYPVRCGLNLNCLITEPSRRNAYHVVTYTTTHTMAYACTSTHNSTRVQSSGSEC